MEDNNYNVDDRASLMVTTRAGSRSDPEEESSYPESSASMVDDEFVLAGQMYGRPSDFYDLGAYHYVRIAKFPWFN